MNRRLWGVLLGLAIVCALSLPLVAAESSVTLDQLIANHIKSIGAPEALAAAQARQIDGTSHFQVVVGGRGELEGKAALVCDGRKMKMGVLFDDPGYNGEAFTTNGEKVYVQSVRSGTRSLLGEFVHNHSQLMSEGLMGGALSSSWALLDLKQRHAKVSFDGLKNVNGQDLYQVTYRPKKNSQDVEIKLYFDKDFRHVLSKYSVTIEPQLGMGASGMGASETASARQTPTRYLVEEMFSGFEQFNGLTLPTAYTLQLTYESGSILTVDKMGNTIWKYDVTFQHFANAPVPPRVFTIQ